MARVEANVTLSLPLEPREPMKSSAVPVGIKHRVAGLFAGIGGLERGLDRSGHETIFLCENDQSAASVLQSHFPAVRKHGDVKTLQNIPRGTTLITAGFPCQDLSQAGQTIGIGGSRSGLVGEVMRLIEKSRTPWVLLENVPFMLQLERGQAMRFIATAFEELGYNWAYRIVDARAFGLPQRRRRVYFLASRVGDPRSVLFADEAEQNAPTPDSNTVACGFYWTEGVRGLGWAVDAVPTLKGGSSLGIPSSPAILLQDGNVVTLDIRDAERLQGFPVDWTAPALAVTKKGHRWKLVGNAVSVPAAEWIGSRMAQPGIPLDFATTALPDDRPWPTAAWNVGEGRMRVYASEWPMRREAQALDTFLKFPSLPLSQKATAGFLKRTERAKLRFPEGFIEALSAHLVRMNQRLTEAQTVSARSLQIAAEPLVYGRSRYSGALADVDEHSGSVREPLAVSQSKR